MLRCKGLDERGRLLNISSLLYSQMTRRRIGREGSCLAERREVLCDVRDLLVRVHRVGEGHLCLYPSVIHLASEVFLP